MTEKKRCKWAENVEPIYEKYHDEQWGVPVYDDDLLFEMLILESFHCGLSWLIILKKREAFKEAFDNFEAEKIAYYNQDKIDELMKNEKIVRNRMKIQATIKNAQAYLKICQEFGSFSKYIWGFTNGEVIKITSAERLTHSELSDKIAKEMKKRGFGFLGTVTIYSYMQAVGIINDHEEACFRRDEV